MYFFLDRAKRAGHLYILGFVLILAACGGGGGSSGGGDGVSLSFSRNSINVTYARTSTIGYDAPSEQVTATLVNASGLVFLQLSHEGDAISAVSYQILNDTQAVINVLPGQNMSVGLHQSVVTIRACKDNACTQEFAGSPFHFAVTATVTQALEISDSTAELQTLEGLQSEIHPVTVIPPQGMNFSQLSATTTYTDASSGWLSAQLLDGKLNLQANASALAAGHYTAMVTVETPGATTQRQLPVALTVGSGLIVPASLSLTVNGATANTDQAYTLNDVVNATVPANWAAGSDQPWLTVLTPNGVAATTQNLQLRVDRTAVLNLENDASYTATITFTSPTLSQVTVPFQLHVQQPEISYVTSAYRKANSSGDYILRGTFLTGLNAPSLRVGGVTPQSISVISSTEIHVSLPGLSVGTAAITATGLRTGAAIHVVNRSYTDEYVPVWSADAQGPNSKAAVYEAANQTLYVLRQTLFSGQTSITRIFYSGGHWQSAELEIPGLLTIARDASHQSLVAVTATDVRLLDLETLATKQSFAWPAALDQVCPSGSAASVTSNDGKVFITVGASQGSQCSTPNLSSQLVSFDLRTKDFTLLESAAVSSFYDIQSLTMNSDGTEMVALDRAWGPGYKAVAFNLANGLQTAFTSNGVGYASNGSAKRTKPGSNQLLGHDWLEIGHYPDSLTFVNELPNSIPSADGQLTYVAFPLFVGTFAVVDNSGAQLGAELPILWQKTIPTSPLEFRQNFGLVMAEDESVIFSITGDGVNVISLQQPASMMTAARKKSTASPSGFRPASQR